MSSMTEDCDTGIYGAKPWTKRGGGAPKPHNNKKTNPKNKDATHTHSKITRRGITKGSETKMLKSKQNKKDHLLQRHTLDSTICSSVLL